MVTTHEEIPPSIHPPILPHWQNFPISVYCGLPSLGAGHANVAKLAYAPDLGSGGVTRGGSSPPIRTQFSSSGADLDILIHSRTQCDHQIEMVFSAEELESHFEAAYREEGRNIALPGFRRGKTPLAIIKQRFGDEIRFKTLEKLANDSFRQALDERNINPFGQPSLEDIDFAPEKGATMKINYETAPDVEAQDYDEVPVELHTHEVTEDEVEQELTGYRRRFLQYEEVDTADDEEGYRVRCDMQLLDAEGNAVEDKLNKDAVLNLDDEHLNRDLKAELLNMKKGETRDVDITYETGDGDEDVDHVRITLHAIERALPFEWNEENCGKLTGGKAKTEEELRALIRDGIEKRYEKTYRDKAENELIEEVIKRNLFDVPPSIIEEILNQFVTDVKERYKAQNVPIDSFDEKAFREARRESALNTARWLFLRDSIIAKEQITLDEADLVRFAEEQAPRYGVDQSILLQYFQSNDQARNNLLAEKVVNTLFAKAAITHVDDNDVTGTAMEAFAEVAPGAEPSGTPDDSAPLNEDTEPEQENTK